MLSFFEEILIPDSFRSIDFFFIYLISEGLSKELINFDCLLISTFFWIRRLLLCVVACLMFCKILSFATLSNKIEQPSGKLGKSFSISVITDVSVLPIICRNLFSKSYSGLQFATKSNTVRHSLLSANLNPLPSCCKNMVRLSVGLKNKTVSIPGISMPSLKISTTHR